MNVNARIENVGPDFGVLSLISVVQVCAGPAIPGPAVRLAKYVFSRSAQQNILEYERPRRLSSEKVYEKIQKNENKQGEKIEIQRRIM